MKTIRTLVLSLVGDHLLSCIFFVMSRYQTLFLPANGDSKHEITFFVGSMQALPWC
jgi:hypothetical protein